MSSLAFGTLLVFGSLGFWISLAVVTCILLLCIEYEKSFTALLSVGLFLVALHYCGNNVFPWIVHNALWAVPLYLGIGVAWGLFKWFLFVIDAKEKFLARKLIFFRGFKIPFDDIQRAGIPQKFQKDWDSRNWECDSPPSRRKHQNRIVLWSAYWPVSMVHTLINDPLRRFFKFVLTYFDEIYDRISNYVFRNVVTKVDDPPRKPIEFHEGHQGD